MDNTVLIFGFDESQFAMLKEALPSEYVFKQTDSITDMIVMPAMCCLVDEEILSPEEYRLLRNYCTEVAGYSNELVVWVGEDPPCELITVCDSFIKLIERLPDILDEAKIHYETQDMYSTPYALLPKRAIEASLEEAISAGIQWRFPEYTNQQIEKQMRREWISLLEADAAVELAAVHELTIWLRRNDIPFYMEGGVTSGLIPYLLGITKTNPLSEDLGGHDLVWQAFCGYGRCPNYCFHLSANVKEQIERWIEKHWIKELYLDSIENLETIDFDALSLMHMCFYFDAETSQESVVPEYCREDVYYYLLRHGFIEKDAFRGMESVRKGFGYPYVTEEMLEEASPILEIGMHCKFLPLRSNFLELQHYVQATR